MQFRLEGVGSRVTESQTPNPTRLHGQGQVRISGLGYKLNIVVHSYQHYFLGFLSVIAG